VSGVRALKGGRVRAEVVGKRVTWAQPWWGAGGSDGGYCSDRQDPRVSENG
jgi:hypothetical protein